MAMHSIPVKASVGEEDLNSTAMLVVVLLMIENTPVSVPLPT
jgi:hypothetical protein